jgi:opacity protein-like surface antigen
MNYSILRLFIAINLLVIVSLLAQAGKNYPFGKYWEFGVFVNTANFHGDLSENQNSFLNNTPFSSYFYQDRKFGGGILINKMFTPIWGVKGIFEYAQLAGRNEKLNARFQGDLFLYTTNVVFDWSNAFLGEDKYRKWSSYAYIGIGFSETRSNAYDLQSGIQIGSTGYKISKYGNGYQRMTETTIPIGLGATYKLNKSITLFFEWNRYFVNTNKLDAFVIESTRYESVGNLVLGATYKFDLPSHIVPNSNPRYNGKSPDPSIREYNKNNHVIMKTKANKKALKQRKKYGRKKNRNNRW